MKGLTTAAIALGIAFTGHSAAAKCDDGEIVARFAHVTSGSHPKGVAASQLQERVNAQMDGRMCVEVYPNSILYNDSQVLDAIAEGKAELAAPGFSKFGEYTSAFEVFSLPFLFQDIDAVIAFQRSASGRKLLDSMQGQGLQGLSYWQNGMMHMAANIPLIRPDDAAGLKFRVPPSDVQIVQMEKLGAQAVAMPFSKVYGALESGDVDGVAHTWANMWGKKFFEVQDGITETSHGVSAYLVVTSTEWINSLDADIRTEFLSILADVTEQQNEDSKRLNREAKDKILAAGGTVRALTPEQRSAWVEAMKPVWAEFSDIIGQSTIEEAAGYNY
ncbi:DctP family TRAP transporter solute-binding subunit [Jannaschia aquimarina]|uniref:DctP_4 protein n=1 Tax=Jannaschia aquimarina TaxID=935700 RepID=A0A0D1ENL4_9RHOB|nr:DctP family TRAP transporter solute-binding subunit [Jannaschia aquimarina]KIT17250.1 C4-dicarboxylate-binding periplasmic protein precursor [Jannaschia aquimarina]SNT19100.1 C4-dicarboxylate-binding protein DctP [Jannaschia aquimarina]